MVGCLLADSRLPHFLWGELFLAASYLYNRAPHSALNHDTPYKTLHGKDADLRHLRVIGAIAFVYIETHQKKLDPRAWEGRVVGFGQNSLAYRVRRAGSQTVRESRKRHLYRDTFRRACTGLRDGLRRRNLRIRRAR